MVIKLIRNIILLKYPEYEVKRRYQYDNIFILMRFVHIKSNEFHASAGRSSLAILLSSEKLHVCDENKMFLLDETSITCNSWWNVIFVESARNRNSNGLAIAAMWKRKTLPTKTNVNQLIGRLTVFILNFRRQDSL